TVRYWAAMAETAGVPPLSTAGGPRGRAADGVPALGSTEDFSPVSDALGERADRVLSSTRPGPGAWAWRAAEASGRWLRWPRFAGLLPNWTHSRIRGPGVVLSRPGGAGSRSRPVRAVVAGGRAILHSFVWSLPST